MLSGYRSSSKYKPAMDWKEKMINLKNLYGRKSTMVLGVAFLLALLNMNPTIHSAVINVDMQVAIKMNSVIGINPFFDQTLALLSTRMGDAFMLTCICSLFVIHSLRGANLNETIRRLSFWIWLGALCVFTYFISCAAEYFVKRDTPLLAFHQFRNLQTTMYGIALHSCPTSSFPSGHGLAYIFFAIMAWRRYFRMSLALWGLTIIMLSVRLIVGLHWLSDIIFGSLFLAALLVSLISDTSLKKTYQLTQQAVSFVIRKLFVWHKPCREVLIQQNEQRTC